ncbi:MAG: DUF2946 family protein [Candidatus Acidiferrales bacterium]
MKTRRDNSIREIRQRVLLVAAFAALFCFLAAGGLWHHDDPSTAAACPICQVAHMPATGPVAQVSLVVMRSVVALAPQPEANLYAAPGLFPSSSRAPPTA